MAKKNTVGGPRARRTTVEDIKRRKEYKSRAEREDMWQRRVIVITAALVIFSVVLLAGAFVWDKFIVPHQAISTVNGTEIKTEDFQERVRFERWQYAQQIINYYYQQGQDQNIINQYAAQLDAHVSFGGSVLDQMEEEILIAQEAKARGVTVDDEELNRQIDEYMAGYAGLGALPDEDATPTPTPTLTPTPLVSPTPRPSETPGPTWTPLPDAEEPELVVTQTPTLEPTATQTSTPTPIVAPDDLRATLDEAADSYYDMASDNSGASGKVIRDLLYSDLLQQALIEDMKEDIPTEEYQANVRHILISFDPTAAQSGQMPSPTDQQKADALARAEEVMAAIQDGEPFAVMAQTYSDDFNPQTGGGSASQGGELGWASPDNYAENFKNAVNEAEPGDIVGPIETEFGYHIIQVLEKDENHPLTEDERENRAWQAFQDWLDEAKADASIKRRSDWEDRVPDKPSVQKLFSGTF